MSEQGNIIVTDRAVPSARKIYTALVGLGICCSLLIATVFIGTQPLIEARRSARLAAAVLDVLPGAIESRSWAPEEGSSPGPGGSDGVIYTGYDSGGALMGFAIEAKGMGYQDEITLLYGYRLDLQRVTGLRILASRETPGLGDRIGTYPAFIASFKALDVSLDRTGRALKNRVISVKEGERTEAWQIDGITGATVSSTAVADIVHRSATRWLPLIHAESAELQGEISR